MVAGNCVSNFAATINENSNLALDLGRYARNLTGKFGSNNLVCGNSSLVKPLQLSYVGFLEVAAITEDPAYLEASFYYCQCKKAQRLCQSKTTWSLSRLSKTCVLLGNLEFA